MKEKILWVHCAFNGLYEWGKGYVNGKHQLWDEYWHKLFNKTKEHSSCHVRLALSDTYCGCDTLFTLGGSIYLHPMDFTAVFRKDYANIDAIKQVIDDCCKYCGVTYDMTVKERTITV